MNILCVHVSVYVCKWISTYMRVIPDLVNLVGHFLSFISPLSITKLFLSFLQFFYIMMSLDVSTVHFSPKLPIFDDASATFTHASI